jgi:hypothetical protein
MMIDFILRSWPSLFATDVRKVTQRDCEAWLSRYQQQYSPSVVNNSIGTLRAVFDTFSLPFVLKAASTFLLYRGGSGAKRAARCA